MTGRAPVAWTRASRAITALHERPELRDVFPVGDAIDSAIRENA